MIPPIFGFIGWHDSGKTTLVSQVVRQLRHDGLKVGVIKSSKDSGIVFGQPDTDTAKHRQAGADPVLFVAPDQVVMLSDNNGLTFQETCRRYLNQVDLILAEGFKDEPTIPKIEVFRGQDLNPLRDQVPGVIAIATDQPVSGLPCFQLDDIQAICQFIVNHLLSQQTPLTPPQIQVTLNGQDLLLSPDLQMKAASFLSDLYASLPHPPTPQTTIIKLQSK